MKLTSQMGVAGTRSSHSAVRRQHHGDLSLTCMNTTNGLTLCKPPQVLLNGKYSPKVCTEQLPSPTSFSGLTLPATAA